MDCRLDVYDFCAELGSACVCDGSLVMACDAGQASRSAYKGDLRLFAQKRFLYLDVCSQIPVGASPVVTFEFWQNNPVAGDPDLTIRLSCLPQVRTRLVVPFSALDAQHIFLERTPGRLRGFVTGTAVSPSCLTRFAIGLRGCWSRQRLAVHSIALSDAMPETELAELPLVDRLGQWAPNDWKGKTRLPEDVTARLRRQLDGANQAAEKPQRSEYGGWTALRFDATGYFHLAQRDGRHWLADPEGYAFFSVGVDDVSPHIPCPLETVRPYFSWLPDKAEYPDAYAVFRGDEMVDFLKVALRRAFGDDWEPSWRKLIASQLQGWLFNTLGNYSALAGLPGVRMPYVWQLSGFPATARFIYRDFPDVFSDEYRENASAYAQQLQALADDKYLIGYFMRNEPEWGFADNLEIAAEMLALPACDFVSKRVFIESLKGEYGTVDALNQAWGTSFTAMDDLNAPFDASLLDSPASRRDLDAFSYRMIREYVRVPAQALREADPNHLNLGMRYAFILYPNQCAGKEFLDVFSINCYQIDPGEVLSSVTAQVRMPVLIGEFHFGAIDAGLGSTGIVGVKTQQDRGLAYQRYIEACALNPYCIGAHWYELYDQFCLGRFDGENYQIGLLDICHRPYEDFIKGVIHTHERLYPLMAGQTHPEYPEPGLAKSNIAS